MDFDHDPYDKDTPDEEFNFLVMMMMASYMQVFFFYFLAF